MRVEVDFLLFSPSSGLPKIYRLTRIKVWLILPNLMVLASISDEAHRLRRSTHLPETPATVLVRENYCDVRIGEGEATRRGQQAR